MQAVTVKCPECNAVLKTGESETVTCSYCGAHARIQRRTAFNLPRPMAPARPTDPKLVARQLPQRRLLAISITLSTLFVVGVFVAIVVATTRRSTPPRPVDIGDPLAKRPAQTTAPAKAAQPDPPHWEGGPPLVLDVDGDGTDDLLGIRRYLGKRDGMALFALSGKDGHILWETPSLGTYSDVYRDKLGLFGDVLVRGDTRMKLYAYAAKTGALLWQKDQPEVVARLCPAAAGSVSVGLADESWWTVALATGERTATKTKRAPRASCGVAQTVDTTTKSTNLEELDVRPDTPGTNVSRVVRRGGPAVGLGYKRPGTAVSQLVGLKNGKLAWKLELAARDPLTALWAAAELAVDESHIVAFYSPDKGPSRLTLVELATGTRVWDVVANGDPDAVSALHIDGIALTRSHVIVTSSGSVLAFDRASGKPTWALRS